jgi:MarR family transcriptional regulator for hemolysin
MESLLARQITFTAKAVRSEFDQRLTEAGGSLTTWIVLRSAEERGLSQREIAERMGVEGPTLVRHLDRLEKEGLIERLRDAADRRITRIAVTPAGRTLLGELSAVAASMEGELRSMLGDKVYDETVASLKRVQVFMTRLSGERKPHADATR